MKMLMVIGSAMLESLFVNTMRLVTGLMAGLTALVGTSPIEYVETLLSYFGG